MKRLFLLLFIFGISQSLEAQNPFNENPKLVVGIVVDQMRYDYLTRFWDKFEENGFKKLVNEGFIFRNNHFNYVPTYTGPGHASVFTGTTPANHGIISNSWFDKTQKRFVYCAGDGAVEPVGTKSAAGKMSPHRLNATSIADENRLHTQLRGKTIGIALKDRGAILPAGHSANAAYWFHGQDEGKWITSSYYMTELPLWVQDFNNSKKVDSYLKTWNPVLNIESYQESGVDENKFEAGFRGKETTTFPYNLKELAADNGNYDIIKATPFGNDLTTDFAKAAIVGENLGQDQETDFLTLSYSSTDYIGHNFGVNSKEVEDAYLRLDKNLADLLQFLDQKIGVNQYTLFLTADHGGVDVPSYLNSVKIPAGYLNETSFTENFQNYIKTEFKEDSLVLNVSNSQVFLNYELMKEKKMDPAMVQNNIASYLLQQDQISKVFTRQQLMNSTFAEGIPLAVQRGFNQKRSGDVIFVLDPGVIVYPETGSTHGSGFAYDTHVPLIFYGYGIKKGNSSKRSEIPDIAPTLAVLLGISFPNSSTGKVLDVLLD